MEGNFFIPVDFFTKPNFLFDGAPGMVDQEVGNVLGDTNMAPDTKYKLFQNALFRYQQLQDKYKKPVEGKINLDQPQVNNIPREPLEDGLPSVPVSEIDNLEERLNILKESPPPDDDPLPLPVDLNSIPRSKLELAKGLWKHISSIKGLEIDELGRISYKGKSNRQSNISDLIADYTKNVRSRPGPGSELLTQALKDSKVSKSLIGNKSRLDEIYPTWPQGRPNTRSQGTWKMY